MSTQRMEWASAHQRTCEVHDIEGFVRLDGIRGIGNLLALRDGKGLVNLALGLRLAAALLHGSAIYSE